MNECVLVVDDDREIVRAIALLLEKEGYTVLRAYDGMQALIWRWTGRCSS